MDVVDYLQERNKKLTKAVEWMKEIGEYFMYKAPEQINGIGLTAAMYATAKDALEE